MKKCALKLDFLLGTFVQLQPVLAAKIQVSLSADIAALGRAGPELLEMQELADEPARALSQAAGSTPRLRRGLRGNYRVSRHPDNTVIAIVAQGRKLRGVIEGVCGIGDSSVHG